MSEARQFASLSSGLLARKGAAKPAMRPQSFGQTAINYEDLGWNDMGNHGQAAVEPAPVPVLTPEEDSETPVHQHSVPDVVEQQRTIARSFGNERPVTRRGKAKAATVLSLPQRSAPTSDSRSKAAFTLRLDQERHLRLRLACAVSNRSAQQIVTEALDQLLDSLPELESFARNLPSKTDRRA